MMRWKTSQTNVIEVIFWLSLDLLKDLYPSCPKQFQRGKAGKTALYPATFSVK